MNYEDVFPIEHGIFSIVMLVFLGCTPHQLGLSFEGCELPFIITHFF